MVAIEEDQKSAGRRRHTYQPGIRESVVVQCPSSVLPPNLIASILRLPIQYTQIQITARIVDSYILPIRIENTMDDEVRESEEETRHAIWMWHKFVAPEKCIENESRIWQGLGGSRVCGGYCSCVGGTGFAQVGIEGVIVGTIKASVCVLNPWGVGSRRRIGMMRRGQSPRKSQVPAGRMRKILVNCTSDISVSFV